MARTTHRGRVTPDERAATPYLYLPVDVPPSCPALTVRLAYDRTAGALDLGCFSADGFRGWSGGERDRFVIAAGSATPGYLPGPLEAGTWHVVLGLHRVPPGGLEYEVVAETGAAAPDPLPAAPPSPERPPRRELPAATGRRWLAADLHSHSVHSDGALTVDELACLAASRGLDVLAVTDHNTTSHHPHLPAAAAHAGIALLAGQELTTGRGHANAFGDIGWIDFRAGPDSWLHETERRGGLLSVNHPLAGDCAWLYRVERRPPLAEVWHATWTDRRWGAPISWWLSWGEDIVPVGGSDWHRPDSTAALGEPTTWLECESGDAPEPPPDAPLDAPLDALREGRVAISAGPPTRRDAPVLLRVEGELVAIGAEGMLLAAPDGSRRVVRCDRARVGEAPGPHWLEAHDATILALTP